MNVTKSKNLYLHTHKKSICTIAVIGYGRFGRVWSELLASVEGISVLVYDTAASSEDTISSSHPISYGSRDMLRDADLIFFCVPISNLYTAIVEYRSFISPHTIVCDTCSVKVLPVQWMKELLPDAQLIVGTHPLFGPDSLSNKGNKQQYLNIVTTKVRIQDAEYHTLCEIFQNAGMVIHELTAESHDRQAVYSQGLTHLIGRVLGKLQLSKSIVSTKGFESLLDIIEQTCNDSQVLFMDIQQYNEGSRKMWDMVMQALKSTIQEIEAHQKE